MAGNERWSMDFVHEQLNSGEASISPGSSE